MKEKIKVGILGATGIVGQNYIKLLENHPWFSVSYVCASESSSGKKYIDAVKGRWHQNGEVQSNVAGLDVKDIFDIKSAKKNCSFVFSALSSSVALEYEEKYANAGIPVISNASAHRWTDDVPLLIPEINPDHLDVIKAQQIKRRWEKGFIIVKPNCSLQSYLLPLYVLHKKYKIKKVILTTLQAVSGAGYPGVSSFDIIDNVIPFIEGEEKKSEDEPKKILGYVSDGKIYPDESINISAHCNRVPTLDGHLACVSVSFEKKPSAKEILHAWKAYVGLPQKLNLPSAPKTPIIYIDEPDRPQPRLDRDSDKGMAVTVGRLRECKVLDYRFVGLSHNTVRGAAGGGILNAELAYKKSLFKI